MKAIRNRLRDESRNECPMVEMASNEFEKETIDHEDGREKCPLIAVKSGDCDSPKRRSPETKDKGKECMSQEKQCLVLMAQDGTRCHLRVQLGLMAEKCQRALESSHHLGEVFLFLGKTLFRDLDVSLSGLESFHAALCIVDRGGRCPNVEVFDEKVKFFKQLLLVAIGVAECFLVSCLELVPVKRRKVTRSAWRPLSEKSFVADQAIFGTPRFWRFDLSSRIDVALRMQLSKRLLVLSFRHHAKIWKAEVFGLVRRLRKRR